MSHGVANSCRKQSLVSFLVPSARRLVIIGAIALVAGGAAIAQNGEVQQKLAAAKQAAAENQQRLRQFQWTETTQLTLKGDPKPATQNLCQYGPDGQVQKTPIGVPPPPSGGRLKQKVVAKKKAEIADYMGQVKSLLTLYVPP